MRGLRSTVSACVAKMPWFVLKASTYSKKQTNKQTKNQILKTQSQDNIRAKKKITSSTTSNKLRSIVSVSMSVHSWFS